MSPTIGPPAAGDPDSVQNVPTFERQVNQEIDTLGADKGFLRWAWSGILDWFSVRPRAEIAHAWLHIDSFAERAARAINAQPQPDEEKRRRLVKVQAYLSLARREADFAQAWSYINLADALLPLVVEEKEIDLCSARLRTWDERMPGRETLEKMTRSSDQETSQGDAAQPKGKGAKGQPNGDEEQRRYAVHREQLIRALLWNDANRKVSLRLALWRSVGLWLLLALGLALVVAELTKTADKHLVSLPFLATALLGFFGGGLSAFLSARDSVVHITSYETIKVHTVLRMLLGAAGAFVIYAVAHWLPLGKVTDLLRGETTVFLTLGIAAGYSERLFVATLEKIASNLQIAGQTVGRSE